MERVTDRKKGKWEEDRERERDSLIDKELDREKNTGTDRWKRGRQERWINR